MTVMLSWQYSYHDTKFNNSSVLYEAALFDELGTFGF